MSRSRGSSAGPGSWGSAAGTTLVLLAAFALGMVAGGALLHVGQLAFHRLHGWGGGPPPHDGPPVEHLRRAFDLTPQQVERARAILDESRARMQAEADATRSRLREILSAELRERFDAMLRRGGPPAPPPPGMPLPPPPPSPEGTGPEGW